LGEKIKKMNANQDRQEEAGAAVAPPSNKRIKSAEADLTIVFRSTNNGQAEETLHYHSVTMAHHSNYFDSLLSSGMREVESKTVTLDGVDPTLFQLAVEILEDPIKSHSATAQDIMKLAHVYNRFEFSKGLQLTETILGNYLEEWTMKRDKSPSPPQMKLITDSILFSREANLENLTAKSKTLLKTKMCQADVHGMGFFQEAVIEKLGSFLTEHKDDIIRAFYTKKYPTLAPREVLTRSDLLSTLYWDMLTCSDTLLTSNILIKLNGRLCVHVNNFRIEVMVPIFTYTTSSTKLSNGQDVLVDIERIKGRDFFDLKGIFLEAELGDWFTKVTIGVDSYIFVQPHSKSMSCPPQGRGWNLIEQDRRNDGTDPTFELLPWLAPAY
jgi:hypothetical protein